ncbi:MAG: ABC transporter ATP-binding protein [bacterium]|nr:ABC transporter ATP-binding protein [Candidatus Sumerlaeota bacterium]
MTGATAGAVVKAGAPSPGFRYFASVLRRYLPFMIPHWQKLFLILILSPLAMTILAGLMPVFSVLILDDAFPRRDFSLVVVLVAIIFITELVRQAYYLITCFVRFDVKRDILRGLGEQFYHHLLKLPLDFHESRPVGERIFRANIDVHDAANLIAVTLPIAASMIIQGVVTALLALLVDWRAVIIVIIFMPPYMLFTRWITAMWRTTERRMRESRGVVTAQLQQTLAGVNVVQACAREDTEKRVYAHCLSGYLRRFFQWQMLSGIAEGFIHPAGLAVAFAFLTNSLWGYFHITGGLTVGQWIGLNALIANVLIPSSTVILYLQSVQRDLVAAERVLEVLDIDPGIRERPDAICMRELRGHIEFRNVTFAYDPKYPVLDNVSFTIEPGMSAAIVGVSGAGKSTIMNLILRLYDPDSGEILIDGRDLRELALMPYRRRFGVVLQRPQLFAGTVMENISYGVEHLLRRELDEGVGQAVRIAECDEFIRQLPSQMNTTLSETGDLSGGQKQRMTIARALARRPNVLLFDEPLASLDPETQQKILANLKSFETAPTRIFATYNLGLVMDAGKIFVLERGKIVGSGTHAELVAARGAYRLMWEASLGKGAAHHPNTAQKGSLS